MDGTALAKKVRARVALETAALVARGVRPGLTVVLVGEDPASQVYVFAKGKACEEAGMKSDTIRLPASTSENELLGLIERLNGDRTVHGILVQMPLPHQIDAQRVLRHIEPAKDVDGFHPVNVGKSLIGDTTGFVPCTPSGCVALLRAYGVETRGAEVVVVGRSNIVGKPLAALLMQPGADATVTVCHSRTRNLVDHTRRADILVAATGRPGLVTGDMVQPGAVVLDVGTNRIADSTNKRGYRLVGDVAFDEVKQVASLITPVPGGVGPMTIAMLLQNTLQSASRAAG